MDQVTTRPEETLGERLVAWLDLYGIDTVFGIPGVHTIEMYRGLGQSRLRHLTPRHEQGAGFAADGYARATGRVAAVFVITGPGLTNMLTPMAQACADSVPMLVVSSVNARPVLGMGAGDLHEVRDSTGMAAHAAAFSHRLADPAQLPGVLARAFAVFEGARPRPVHLEIPRDLFAVRVPAADLRRPVPVARPAPAAEGLARAAGWLAAAARPLILAGGGAVAGAADIRRLAQRLGAPVVMTANARGILPGDDPLAVPASPSLAAVRALIARADVVLALGTEIGHTDYDMYDRGGFAVPGRLIRVDLDPEQLHRGAPPALALAGDAAAAARGLLAKLGAGGPMGGLGPGQDGDDNGADNGPDGGVDNGADSGAGDGPDAGADSGAGDGPDAGADNGADNGPDAGADSGAGAAPGGALRAAAAMAAARAEIGAGYRACGAFLDTIRAALPGVPVVGDSTNAVYAGNLLHAAPAPRLWFNAATGYGALGYGLPAAIGAARGTNGPVVCLAGDGGAQFTLPELGLAVEARLPVILIVWNNRGYGEIGRYMDAACVTRVGVDLVTPDFVAIARAYGAAATRLERLDALPALLAQAAGLSGPTLIEVEESLALGR